MVQNLTPADDGVTFHFDFGDGTTSTDPRVEHVYEKDGTYTIKIIAQREFCTYEETIQLPVYKVFIPNVFTPDGSPGLNDTFEIGFGADMIAPSNIGMPVQLTVVDRWGRRVFRIQRLQKRLEGTRPRRRCILCSYKDRRYSYL